ncbi:ATP-binding protein [Candidatus Micrarchaeota archaeon]|nr:ATP-binding protein [Candidatus Micrarchaeota archaeon]
MVLNLKDVYERLARLSRNEREETITQMAVKNFRFFTFPGQIEYLSIARRLVRARASRLGFPEEQLDDLEYAVGEAFGNAVKHGCKGIPERKARIEVSLGTSKGHFKVETIQPGEGVSDEIIREARNRYALFREGKIEEGTAPILPEEEIHDGLTRRTAEHGRGLYSLLHVTKGRVSWLNDGRKLILTFIKRKESKRRKGVFPQRRLL